MKPVRLAILGLGTVGGGALKLLKKMLLRLNVAPVVRFKLPMLVRVVRVLIWIYLNQLNKVQICSTSYVNLM